MKKNKGYNVRQFIGDLLDSEMDEQVLIYHKEEDEFYYIDRVERWSKDTVLVMEEKEEL
jgi:hypothetical protein